MKKTINVMVIGTEPPCPRCDLLKLLVQKAAPQDITVNIRHTAFDSDSARQLGMRLGLKVGTAKHVASKAGVMMNWNEVYKIIEQKKSTLAANFRPADAWTQELDDILKPCQEVAEASGYLMTPVLIVEDKVVHHGSVPTVKQLSSWL